MPGNASKVMMGQLQNRHYLSDFPKTRQKMGPLGPRVFLAPATLAELTRLVKRNKGQ